VLGVVQPGAVQAVAATRNGRVGLLATPATVESGAYAAAIAAADPFVVDTVRTYCEPLREAEVDTVVLGCTHYPLVRPMLQRMLGRGVEIIVSGDPLAHQVEHVLGARGLANPRGEAAGRVVEGRYSFLCTGDTEAFRTVGTRFLQLPLADVEPVALVARELVAGVRS
jgi:glutamate racemase